MYLHHMLDYLTVWFTTLDLKSWCWQAKMDEASKPLTTFTAGLLGFCKCNWMPFGITNAPAAFQILMELCLGKLQLNRCLIYLDDIIMYSKMPKDHLIYLRVVLQRLKDARLKLKLTKCEFFHRSLMHLGHYISEKDTETNSHKMQVIRDWPVSKTVTEIRSFLGFGKYYSCFI